MATPADFLALARPRQWLKNLLVAAAPLAAGILTTPAALGQTLLGILAFSLASSAMYAFNDVSDVAADRMHPQKRTRPVASGAISLRHARVFGFTLIAAAILVSVWTGSALFVGIVTLYMTTSLLYSYRLRDVAFADILVIAFGFLLRAFGGGAVTDVPLTVWFMMVTVGGALFVSAGRRLAELNAVGSALKHRPALDRYGSRSLIIIIAASGLLIGAAYIGWAISMTTSEPGTWWAAVSCVPFLIGLGRYAYLIARGRAARPEVVVTTDLPTIVTGLVWLGTLVLTVHG